MLFGDDANYSRRAAYPSRFLGREGRRQHEAFFPEVLLGALQAIHDGDDLVHRCALRPHGVDRLHPEPPLVVTSSISTTVVLGLKPIVQRMSQELALKRSGRMSAFAPPLGDKRTSSGLGTG
jgi:hypothetical protein